MSGSELSLEESLLYMQLDSQRNCEYKALTRGRTDHS